MVANLNVRPAAYAPPESALEIRLCRFLFETMLTSKRIRVDFSEGTTTDLTNDAEFILAPPKLWPTVKLMLAPNFWVGETFVAGAWYLKEGNLSEFLRACKTEASMTYRKYYDLFAKARGLRHFLGQYVLNKTYTRKVRQHYDLDSQIYEMFLDHEMVYTCGYFKTEQDSLWDAQRNKIDLVLSRLPLSEGVKVLDIGCGWGSTARALVRRDPTIEVCGLSISKAQIEWAKHKDANTLSTAENRRIEYRLEDYVNHSRLEYYDAVSVIGMIEHVGLGGYDDFLQSVHKFLKPKGTAIVHSIVCPVSDYPTNKWIDEYIFTGGYAPSLAELTRSIERHPFHVSGIHLLSPRHYRRTIECWIENYTRNIPNITAYLSKLNLSIPEIDRFIRTWLFYLSSVRNMFANDTERPHQVVHVVMTKL